MKNKQFFILILLLVIGFASISATLIINGNTKVAANIDDFNVIFIEGFLNGETSPNVEIDSTKKVLTFTTDRLKDINDTARIDYKVKNISTQYDGDVTINCTNEANNYVNVTSSFDGKTLPLTTSINMQAQEVKSGYINAELTKATTEDQEVKVTCKIEVNATSRTNYAYSLSFDSNGGTNVEDKVVEYNTSYGELGIPTKEGYTFIGWFNEDDVKVDEETILDTKGNKTLIAKWASIAYPVSLKKIYSAKTETSEINIPYGESIDTLITVGEDYYISNIECTNGYTIENFNSSSTIYNEQTIRINNNKVAKESICTITVNQGIYDFNYTGDEQEFIVPFDGNYKIELWGAGSLQDNGAYTSGTINLDSSKDILYMYIGSTGALEDGNTLGGYNGGGNSTKAYHGNSGVGGAGATDVRLVNGLWNNFDSLKSRIMVAGGASHGGASAGGLTGYRSVVPTELQFIPGWPGTQTNGGKVPTRHPCGLTDGTAGGFGYGGNGGKSNNSSGNGGGSGGGSGYYGGSGAGGVCNGSYAGGGGSSFISGHNGCDAISKDSTSSNIVHTGQANHYSGYTFKDTVMIDGAGYKWTNVKGEQTGMPTHDGKSTMTGNTDNGYAKITYLGE